MASHSSPSNIPSRLQGWGRALSSTTNPSISDPTPEENGLKVMAPVREDDAAQTSQAIEEGRRLYVGNVPYAANIQDVENLFVGGDYVM